MNQNSYFKSGCYKKQNLYYISTRTKLRLEVTVIVKFLLKRQQINNNENSSFYSKNKSVKISGSTYHFIVCLNL